MRTIFIPTDFSDASLVALKYAVEIAQTAGADLVLYSAVHLPPPVADLGAVAAPPPADELMEDTRKALLGLAKELEAHTTQRIEVVVELGLASDCIEEWMEAHRPWLTVMASKGTTGLERMVWGSVTRHVAEHAPTPLLAAALAGVLSATAEVISDQAEIAEDSPADVQHEDLEDWQDQRKKAIAELRNLDDTQPLLIGGSILRDAEKITEILSD